MPARRDASPPPPSHVQPKSLAFSKPHIPLVILDDIVVPELAPAAASTRAGRGRRAPAPLAALAVFSVLSAALGFGVLANDGSGASVYETLRPRGERVAQFLGFGLDQVIVTGHRFTPDGDVFDALELPKSRTLISLDAASARARIEELAWVDKAILNSVWPGGLEVRITERSAWALWMKGEREFLIDRTGRVLAAVKPGTVAGMKRFAGDGAPAEAMPLTTSLERFPDIARRVVVAERVGARRWTLRLDNNTIVHLPPDREATALEALNADERLRKVIHTANRVVDLRTPGRAAVRAQPVRTSAADTATGADQ